jgi:hypothetical protein
MDKATIIVIIGPPRGGTTMLHGMLCDRPLPECSVVTLIIELYRRIVTFTDQAKSDAFFGSRAVARSMFQHLLQSILDRLEAYPLILKDPMMALHLPYARELFPDKTKFIAIIRDPRDVVASLKRVRQRSASYHGIRRLCKEVVPFYDEIARGDLLTVKYEEVVQWEQETVSKIERFAGLTASSKGYQIQTENSHPWFSPKYGKPVSDERVSSYSESLNALETAVVEYRFREHMKHWGYPASGIGRLANNLLTMKGL